jgi:hypothetical protein
MITSVGCPGIVTGETDDGRKVIGMITGLGMLVGTTTVLVITGTGIVVMSLFGTVTTAVLGTDVGTLL